MKLNLIASLFISVVAVSAQAANLADFAQTQTAFNSARAPQAKELENALWMATSIASSPQIRGALSGVFPNGRIPADNNEFVRQIARIDVNSANKVTMKINTTDAEIGVHIDEVTHEGRLGSKEMTVEAAGDSQTCATKSICRTLSDKTLLCAQVSDDSRKECTRSYKKGSISSYLGYSPVHP